MEQPDVSVILCTHNPRADYLNRVLVGLRRQTLSVRHWELLLIDNASKESIADRFDIGWHSNGRHVREDELGLSPARLRGISEGVAELLLFVDDDIILDAITFEMVPGTCSDLASCRRPPGSLYSRRRGNFSSKTRPRPLPRGISQS